MSQSDAFLAEILQSPEDDAPRLIFADWLEELNDPRGEFIRIQCELARQPVQSSRLDPLEKDLLHEGPAELHIREAELLRDYGQTWLGPVAQFCSKPMFHRGFVDFIEISAANFIQHGSQLFASQPIRSASIVGALRAGELSRCPYLSRLNGLALGPHRMDPAELERLLAAEHFPYLTRLIMIRNHLSDEHATLLAASHRLERLTELDLTDNDIRNRGVRALVNSSNLANLTSLVLNMNSIRLLGARAIAESPYLKRLARLDLRNNEIPRPGIDLVRARFGRSVCEA